MLMQIHITELEKEPSSIDLRVINSLLTTQRLFILIQGMQFMFWMVYLLHHETDLNIEEHYTDTAGYTDQIFGLTHLLGLKFAKDKRSIGLKIIYNR
jgi:hypothetical protein